MHTVALGPTNGSVYLHLQHTWYLGIPHCWGASSYLSCNPGSSLCFSGFATGLLNLLSWCCWSTACSLRSIAWSRSPVSSFKSYSSPLIFSLSLSSCVTLLWYFTTLKILFTTILVTFQDKAKTNGCNQLVIFL